jgi:hypothetical protein
MRLPLCIVLATFLTSAAYAQQSTPLFMERDNVYHIADSIRQSLVADGVDTLILHYRTRYWHPIKTSDGLYQEKTAFILWVRGRKVSYQWIGSRADHQAKTEYIRESNYGHLFSYYLTNKDSIDNSGIEFKYQLSYGQNDPIEKKAKEETDYNVFTYQVGPTARTVDWNSDALRFESTAADFDRLNTPLYNWVRLVEESFRNALDERWTPVNMKEIPYKEEKEDFMGAMERFADERKRREVEFKKFHNFDKQEFEIPVSVRGLVTIIQKSDCGERLKIKNNTRLVRIPTSGVLILKENYLDFYKELFMETDRANTIFYQVDGDKRTIIPVLQPGLNSHVFKDNLGIYMQLLSTHNDKKIEYSVISFFVGTLTELEKFDHVHLNTDTNAVVDALAKCR